MILRWCECRCSRPSWRIYCVTTTGSRAGVGKVPELHDVGPELHGRASLGTQTGVHDESLAAQARRRVSPASRLAATGNMRPWLTADYRTLIVSVAVLVDVLAGWAGCGLREWT